jgi:hypothetical protein
MEKADHRHCRLLRARRERPCGHRLKLKVNQAKSAVAEPSVRKFLGFSFTYGERPRRCIAPQAPARFKARVRELTRRTCGRSLAQIVNELSVYLVGWRGYFGFCQTPSAFRALDEWTRRRLRAIVWKQWKRGRTRFAELRRRGVGRDLAARTAGSPHGSAWLPSQPRTPALDLSAPLTKDKCAGSDVAEIGAPAPRGLAHLERVAPQIVPVLSSVLSRLKREPVIQADPNHRTHRLGAFEKALVGRAVADSEPRASNLSDNAR